ncbi:alpha/beta hydrolase [Comamonadaceae bacterium G21597-S1]|nr:alpha/beta hydrolase [Comamonadaceae bacterium G21597-S1]
MVAGERLPGIPEPMHIWRGAGGLQIAGDSWGDRAAPMVVLLHGGGQTRHSWKGTGEQLAREGYYVVAFDARGHGDSAWDPELRYDSDFMVEDLACVVAAMGGRRPTLVGASMGGGVSLLAAGEGRVDALALVLVDIAPRIEKDGARRVQEFMHQKPEGFDSLEEVEEAILNYQPQRARRRNLEGLAKNVRRTMDGKYRWHWDPRRRHDGANLLLRQQRLEDATRRIRVPTLLVRGELSDILSEEGVAEFLALCPQAEHVVVPGAAHMVAGDRNDAFGVAMRLFLARHVPVAC